MEYHQQDTHKSTQVKIMKWDQDYRIIPVLIPNLNLMKWEKVYRIQVIILNQRNLVMVTPNQINKKVLFRNVYPLLCSMLSCCDMKYYKKGHCATD
ncbi:hypothetical protein G9A89_009266 [Geosiphon pyriformis]|nr:hypothetical protein G9A89_009266 [Geosiphon pyriformis]